MSRDQDNSTPVYAIGAVSHETGIPVDTLRTWERRYGFPSPERTTGNQRVYSALTVAQLLLVREGLRRGHRIGNLMALDREGLQALLGDDLRGADETALAAPEPASPEDLQCMDPALRAELDTWITACLQLDGVALERAFLASWNAHGALRFLSDRAAPFLVMVGAAWADGRIGVLHEHFASERLRDFLTSMWRPLTERAHGPRVVCATLPRERHALGLHLVATTLALAGCRVVFLGADTPLDDIQQAAEQTGTQAIFLSISRVYPEEEAVKHLRALRAALHNEVTLVIGGAGAPESLTAAHRLTSLDQLHAWAMDNLVQRSSATASALSAQPSASTAAGQTPSR